MNIIRPKYLHFTREYNTFALFNLVILACGLYIPAFRGQLSLQRIYEVTFVVLAPFCIIGLYYISNSVIGLLKPTELKKRVGITMKVIGMFLVLFFILNTGLIDYEVGQPSTLPIDNTIDAPIFSQGEYDQETFDAYRKSGVRLQQKCIAEKHGITSVALSNAMNKLIKEVRVTLSEEREVNT